MNSFPARATNSLVRFATVLLCTALPVESAAPPVPPIGTAHEPPPPPKSPADSCAAIRIRDGLSVSLAVAEPLVVSPVAIDWGADGKLWVAEMRDYPMGGDGKFAPGGTIRLLEDTDGDGRYDKATVFLDGLPFPTGVTAWGRGVLICAAPDIIFAEDTNGDGRADVVKKWFTGFLTDNYQARVNSLALGLDNWIHGANGLLGGTIRGSAGANPVDIRGRDFRFYPGTGAFEPASGITQQGRCRDDWDNWFGCNNSRLAFHFPLPEHYLRRNPHVPAPEVRADVPADAEPNRLFPISTTLERFNRPDSVNQTTSACGLGLYRDDLLAEMAGDAFVCEPVHNLVHRLKLTPKGVTFEGHRPADEQTSEFLASTDHWFRPVQVRTGPDGALWIVDMYRGVIEHPRWIPGDKLAKLDVRAGADKGRIYRVSPVNTKPRPIRDLTKLALPELVAALDTPNGTARDLAHMELLHRADATAATPLADLMRASKLPAVRLQALCVLDGLHLVTPDILLAALADPYPAVRRQAVGLCEGSLTASPELTAACLALTKDPDIGVRFQLALSLGEWDDPRAAKALAAVAGTAGDDSWMRAAVLSSSARRTVDILREVLALPHATGGHAQLIGGLIATAAATAEDLGGLIHFIAPAPDAAVENWQVLGLLHLQDALDRRKTDIGSFTKSGDAAVRAAAGNIRRVYEAVHALSVGKAEAVVKLAAIRLFGRGFNDPRRDLPLLGDFIVPTAEPAVQKAALDTLARSHDELVPGILLAAWPQHGPAMRVSIINTLLSRDEWTLALLTAVGKGTVAPDDVPAASRELLATHGDPQIRLQARAVLPPRPSGGRSAIMIRYRNVADLRGDGAKGAAVFRNVCSSCHSYLGQGQEIGPDIGTYRSKEVQDFLIAILNPNAVVEPRFTAYTVQTKDGRARLGVISNETATSLVLSQPGGVRETILRSDITSLRGSPSSLMPEGLEQAIPPQDMADLIAYLKGGG